MDFIILVIVVVLIVFATQLKKLFQGGFQGVLDQLEEQHGRPGQADRLRHRNMSVTTRPPGVGPPPVPARRPGQVQTARPQQAKPVPPIPGHKSDPSVHPLKASPITSESWDVDQEQPLSSTVRTTASQRRTAEKAVRRATRDRSPSRFVRGLKGAGVGRLRQAMVLSDVLGPPVAIRGPEDRLAD